MIILIFNFTQKMKYKEIKYSIITDKFEEGIPTYFILKSTYWFGFNMFGELFGIDGCANTPFQDLESAMEFKKLLENGK